jgi:hypothetical protein
VRAHYLGHRTCIYTWETDIADVGQQGTFLIAFTNKPDQEVDARIVEIALSTAEPLGLELVRGALSGTLDEMRTVLPRRRMMSLLVDALDEVGEGFAESDAVEELSREAPEHLEPRAVDWKTWIVERYFGPLLSENQGE